MADKKNIYKNQIMYTSNSRQIRPNNTYHSNLSNRNFKEFAMHPLQYRNNAIHNLKPFLEKQRQPQFLGNASVSNQNNSNVTDFDNNSLRQPLANNKPDLSNLLNNNLTKMVVNETIIENILTINSYDRDVTVYKDPFTYTVKFNPTSDTRIKQADGTYVTYKGDPTPWIKLDFEKVRYLKLELAVLPTKTYKIVKENDANAANLANLETAIVYDVGTNPTPTNLVANQKYLTATTTYGQDIHVIHFERDATTNKFLLEFKKLNNTTVVYRWTDVSGAVVKHQYTKTEITNLTEKPHILMNVDEIKDINEFSTNESTKTSFNALYPYHTRGNLTNFHSANVDKVYRFSELGHIKKLTISFSDNVGNKLSLTNNLNTDDDWVNMDPKDEIDDNGDPTAKSPSQYIRHPYHTDYQHHLLFKLGTIENEIDKKVFH